MENLGATIKYNDQKVVIELDLRDTKVTDAGLVHLKGLTQLEWLWLSHTQVTDAGLVHLKGMTNLQRLGLPRQITDAGLTELQQALPDCRIKK